MTGPWRRAGSRGPTVFCSPLNERGRGPDSSLLFGEGGGFTSHSTQGKTKKVLIYSGFVSFLSFFFFETGQTVGFKRLPPPTVAAF